MPKDKLRAYYDDLAPSAALQERLKSLPEATPKKAKRMWLSAALSAAAVLALIAAGGYLHPKSTGVSTPAVPEKPPVVAVPEPKKTEATPVPQETPLQTQTVPNAPKGQPAASGTALPKPDGWPPELGWETGTGSNAPAPAEETLCPVAGSYACVDGRDLITLWSIDDPADAVTLDVTEQMRGGAYCERIEHGGAAVTVSLTRETDGSCTLLVEWNGEEESV